ncbi:hypothetical protein CR513_44649, partial [Mucuna pruriens]
MNINHEAAGLLGSNIISIRIWSLWRLVLSLFLHLPITKAEECQIVSRIFHNSLGLERLNNILRKLLRDQMQSPNVFRLDAISTPSITASKKILILNVDEILCASNSINISILNAAIYYIILPTNKTHSGSIFRSLWEPKSSSTINGSK